MSPLTGVCLNTEEVAGLEVAMMKRKMEENLKGKMFFWGKIYGSTQDYLIVYNIDPFTEFPDKKYYYCTPSDYLLRALPPLSKEYEEMAEKLRVPFTGDPSFFAFNGEDPDAEPEDPDAPPVERFKEVNRLSYAVKKIDRDCAIVPRGALVVDATKKVIPNVYFEGLMYDTACETRAYQHFRRPERLQSIALLKKPGIIKSGDFLDAIDKDTPGGMYCLPVQSINVVRCLLCSDVFIMHT
jgi:radial spoke head protein 9